LNIRNVMLFAEWQIAEKWDRRNSRRTKHHRNKDRRIFSIIYEDARKARFEWKIDFVFQPLFDRKLNGKSEYRIPVLQNHFLAELRSKYWERPKNKKKHVFKNLAPVFCSRRFQASRQSFPDSALKISSGHVISRAVGQKIDFYENPKSRGLKRANLFWQIYHRFQERS
jgi:hypothetical protein